MFSHWFSPAERAPHPNVEPLPTHVGIGSAGEDARQKPREGQGMPGKNPGWAGGDAWRCTILSQMRMVHQRAPTQTHHLSIWNIGTCRLCCVPLVLQVKIEHPHPSWSRCPTSSASISPHPLQSQAPARLRGTMPVPSRREHRMRPLLLPSQEPDASTAPVGQHLASSSTRVHTRVASTAPAGTQPFISNAARTGS